MLLMRKYINALVEAEQEEITPSVLKIQSWFRASRVRHNLKSQGIVFRVYDHLSFATPGMMQYATQIQRVWYISIYLGGVML